MHRRLVMVPVEGSDLDSGVTGGRTEGYEPNVRERPRRYGKQMQMIAKGQWQGVSGQRLAIGWL